MTLSLAQRKAKDRLEKKEKQKPKTVGKYTKNIELKPFALPKTYDEFLSKNFPKIYIGKKAFFQDDFWEHIWSIKKGIRPRPFIGEWPRGFAKTTNGEVASVAFGLKGFKYLLYISETQSQADDRIQNIGSLLESKEIAEAFPTISNKKVNKEGNSKGWRRNRLYTASGFVCDGIGLDVARRGVKLEENRPDVIIFDDIDNKLDSLQTTLKKIKTLTQSLIPAGSNDVAIIGLQNIIIKHGIFARLAGIADEEADFLFDRIVSGPYPAVIDAQYGKVWNEEAGREVWQITAGMPTWPEVKPIEVLNELIMNSGLQSFREEQQHEVGNQTGDLFKDIIFEQVEAEDLPDFDDIQCWGDVAVTSTDKSDNQALSVAGLHGYDVYALSQWEGIDTPNNMLKRGILLALRWGCSVFGIETNQGGDLWESSYDAAFDELYAEGELDSYIMKAFLASSSLKRRFPDANEIDDLPESIRIELKKQIKVPYRQRKVSAAKHGSKPERHQNLQTAYEQGGIYHLIGESGALEQALRRLPFKPHDLADAFWHSWYEFTNPDSGSSKKPDYSWMQSTKISIRNG